jgi:hypothetical protein
VEEKEAAGSTATADKAAPKRRQNELANFGAHA